MPIRIADYCDNRSRVKSGQRYGIEVEAEGLPIPLVRELDWSVEYHRYWRTTEDGSLRNGGIEFVTRPLPRTSVPPAIASLWRYFDEGRMRASVRTGVHIHCNCIGMTTDDVTRILLHYALLEPELFRFVGATREENIYCIPWYRALNEPENVGAWMNGRFVAAPRKTPCKYSALYAGPLTTFGTIEFRHAPTWASSQDMLRWFQIVQALYNTWTTDYDVLAKWEEIGPEAFSRMVLPFSWLDRAPESAYEDADVATVASLLLPRQEVVSSFWGKAPELAHAGSVGTRRMSELDNLLFDNSTGNADARTLRTLTVNVSPRFTGLNAEEVMLRTEEDFDYEPTEQDYEPEYTDEEEESM